MRITVDTSVLARASAKATGPARELIHAILESGSRLVLSPYVLEELDRVLRYPRLRALYNLADADIWDHVRFLENISEMVEPADGPAIVLKDPKDDPILYTALAGQVDFLCTLDKHFYESNVLAFCSRHRIRLISDVELLHGLRRMFRPRMPRPQ